MISPALPGLLLAAFARATLLLALAAAVERTALRRRSSLRGAQAGRRRRCSG